MINSLLIQNPVAYLFQEFFFGSLVNPIQTLLMLSLLTTVFTYPFLYLSRFILEKLEEEKQDWSDRKREMVTSLGTAFLFWLFIRTWYALIGKTFIPDILSFIEAVLIIGILGYGAYFLGREIHSRFTDKWDMPFPISLLVITYLMNLFTWVVLYLFIIVINIYLLNGFDPGVLLP